MSQQIINGDSAEVLKTIDSNTIDAVITDPPYGIEFLGKDWDRNTGAMEIWQECLRVLKPGGYLLAFSAARTYHHLATNIESVGFEIRDQIMWLYASGFPKAQDIGKGIQKRQGVEKYHTEKGTNAYPHTTKNQKMVVGGVTADDYRKEKTHPVPTSPEAQQWAGWKTALKPAHEPIVMARKPMKGSTIDNVLTHGVGALNIDATRIPFDKDHPQGGANGFSRLEFGQKEPKKYKDQYSEYSFGAPGTGAKQDNLPPKFHPDDKGRYPSNVLGEVEGYQKYFYCPKVSRKERHRGFEQKHIHTSTGGFLGTDGEWAAGHWHGEDGNKNKDTLSSTATTRDLLMLVGGKYVAEDGTLIAAETTGSCPGKMVWLPGVGKIFAHGLKHEVEKILRTQNRADEIPRSQGNNHPTVKPVELMKYLVKLVTAAGAHIIDPFAGSGSTGMACRELGRQFTGIDLDTRYCAIAEQRIAATQQDLRETLFD